VRLVAVVRWENGARRETSSAALWCRTMTSRGLAHSSATIGLARLARLARAAQCRRLRLVAVLTTVYRVVG
jgi:hypothetical protein